jgi:Domain of unknown function (DUF4340)
MQRKENIQLLISLTCLIATITLLTFFLNRKADAVDVNLFRVEDFTQVDKVVLTKQSDTLSLKFDGTRWEVNSQLADRRMIDVLFATLQQAQPKRPVAESIQDSVNTVLEKDGALVSLFVGDELQKDFFVGGNTAKTQTYFKSKEEDQSYVVVIPGYRVYTGGVFELDETDWKDKYVFSFNWRNFQSLKSFTRNAKDDFEIAMGKTYYEVKGVASVDTTKLNDFLDAVSLLTVDQYVKREKNSEYDSLLATQPIVKLEVSDVSGKNYSLSLFEMNDKALVMGSIQGTQLAFFDRRKLLPIVKSQSWFVKK